MEVTTHRSRTDRVFSRMIWNVYDIIIMLSLIHDTLIFTHTIIHSKIINVPLFIFR